MTPKRKHLNDYSTAHRDMELTDQAICMIARVSQSRQASAAMRMLKREQQRNLRRLDKAAEMLGAPYEYALKSAT